MGMARHYLFFSKIYISLSLINSGYKTIINDMGCNCKARNNIKMSVIATSDRRMLLGAFTKSIQTLVYEIILQNEDY